MEIVTVKNKFQIVIPQAVRKQIGVEIGDIMEAKVEKGKITFTPKSILDRELDISIAEMNAGKGYGPFETAEEAIKFLHSNPSEKKKYIKKK